MSVWRTNKRGKHYKRKIYRAIDGDTFEVWKNVQGSHSIRIEGINCPEKGQRGYSSAKKKLASLEGTTVTIRPKALSYGRIVADVGFLKRKLKRTC